ncbi:MAG: radical SAM protein, partial [Anaerolineae bacterium]|nr:radical SAM protein [Anaerolineae bacterium]
HPRPESLLRALAESGTHTLTLAPEAGSERLRRAIAKGVRREHVLAAAERAQQHGFPQLKLYFMIGLPGESDDDVEAIAELVREIRRRFRRRITVHVTPFVPKPHTAFQRQPMADVATLHRRGQLLAKSLRPRGVALRIEGTAWARVQAALSRGDRALGQALAGLSAPTLANWRRTLRAAGLDEEDYLSARWPEEPLPWNVVDESCGREPAGTSPSPEARGATAESR